MQLAKNIPTVTAPTEGKAQRPNGAEWWIEIDTPLMVKPTRLNLKHHDETWATWECAAHHKRSDEDQINTGIRSLLELSRVLMSQVEPLHKVGLQTASALEYGVDPHRDLKTGKLPDDITGATNQRATAEQSAWKKVAPVAERLGAGITRDGFTDWARDIMNGNTSTGISQLL